MAKSAINRHHTARVKRNCKNYWGRSRDPLTARDLGVLSKTRQVCGRCWCCNRQRMRWGCTFQELRLFQNLD